MMTLVALLLVVVLAYLWADRRVRLAQFRPFAPLAGPASTARVRPGR